LNVVVDNAGVNEPDTYYNIGLGLQSHLIKLTDMPVQYELIKRNKNAKSEEFKVSRPTNKIFNSRTSICWFVVYTLNIKFVFFRL